MKKIRTKLKKKVNNSYKIFIKKGIFEDIAKYLKKEKVGQKYAIVTDSIVEKLFARKLKIQLTKAGIRSEIICFEKGEKQKTLKTVEELAEKMLKKNIDRKDAVLAIGGGVVGDIAGFTASVFMRGIPYIHIPTTLLAMVDSAIGGKTGVDLPGGKNLIGTITQPKAVFIDINFLEKLPETQLKSGLAEVIKYGVIKSKSLFRYMEKHREQIFARDEKALVYLVKESVKIKAKIVEKDENEGGHRMLLNYGHTYGHALELMSNYTLLHGYAISIGMVIVNKIAVRKRILKKEDSDCIKKLLNAYGLPINTIKNPVAKDIMHDKKRQGEYINLVVPTKIGNAVIIKEKCQ